MPTGPVAVTCMDNVMWDPDPSTFVCDTLPTTGEDNLNYTIVYKHSILIRVILTHLASIMNNS